MPSAYIRPKDRKKPEDATPSNASAMLNPNIARLRKMKELADKQKNSKTEKSKPVEKASKIEKAIENSKSSLDERVIAAAEELNKEKNESHSRYSQMQNSLSVDSSLSARQRTSSNSDSNSSGSQANAPRRSNNLASYPDHLSTIRSPIPRSPDPGSQSQTNDKNFGRRSPNPRNVSCLSPSDKPRKCRKMATDLLGKELLRFIVKDNFEVCLVTKNYEKSNI